MPPIDLTIEKFRQEKLPGPFHRFVRLGEYPIDWGGSPELHGDEWLRVE